MQMVNYAVRLQRIAHWLWAGRISFRFSIVLVTILAFGRHFGNLLWLAAFLPLQKLNKVTYFCVIFQWLASMFIQAMCMEWSSLFNRIKILLLHFQIIIIIIFFSHYVECTSLWKCHREECCHQAHRHSSPVSESRRPPFSQITVVGILITRALNYCTKTQPTQISFCNNSGKIVHNIRNRTE